MEALIAYIQPFFGWLLQTTLIASVVICLILAIQKTLGGRLGPRWCHALWLVLLVRMALPWAPPSPLSLSNLIPSWDIQTQAPQSPGTVKVQEISPAEQAAGTPEVTPSQEPESQLVAQKQAAPSPRTPANAEGESWLRSASIRRALPILWLGGAIVIGVYLLVSDLALWRIVKRDRPLVNQSMLELFEECKAQMGVQSLVAVVPSEQVRSPGLFGFVRPRLLLPRQMLDTATRQEMRYVFLHELAHLRRHDIYLGWLASILQVLHWFNPLVWFALYRMRADRELACDALVLTRTGQDKSQEYGGAIVGLVRRFSQSRPLPAMAGVIESKSQLKRRIAMITQFKHNSYRWSPLAAALIVILACISLPDAMRTKASEPSAAKPTHQPNFRKIRIPTKPQNGVLSPDGNKLAFMSDDAVWVVPLHGKVDPDIAGEPVRLTDVPGIWDASGMMAWSADGEWIAVYGGNQPDSDEGSVVSVLPVAGGKPRVVQLPEQGGHLWSYRLSLSPDGQMLAFSALALGKPREEVSDSPDRYIYTIPTAGGKPKQVSSSWARLPSFSPDGQFIAYVGYRKREDWPENTKASPYNGDLWVVPTAGGTPVKLATVDGRLRGPVWSPDGKYIAAHHEPGGTNDSKEIWVFPLSPSASSAGKPEKIALPRSSMNMLAGWTPEGQLGVFLECEEHWAGYTVPASGGKAMQITPESIVPYYPRWSPDGNRIYFRGVYKEEKNVKVETLYVPAAGGDPVEVVVQSERRLLVRVPGGGLNISPDGKKIVFSAFQIPYDPKEGADVWTIPLYGGIPTRLTNDASVEGYPCWSPDGEQIAFVDSHPKSDGESFNAISIVPAEGGEIRQVSSEWDNIGNGAIAFSPDAERIAFFSSDKAIKTIPVEGGQPEVLVAGVNSGRHSQLCYCPDGSKIAYNAGGKIWITSLGREKPEELRTGLPEEAKPSEFDWSPDGEKIAFIASNGGEKEFWLIENFLPSAAVAKPEPMTTVRRIGGDWGTFASLSPDGKYLCDVDWDTENLALLELATGKVRHLTGKNPDDAGYPLESAISPDNREVAYLWWDPNTKASSLHVVGLDGSGRRLLCEGKYPMPKAWSADSKKILAVISENDVQQMVWVSASDGSMQHISSFPGESLGYPGKFDISPDGRFIAYDRPGAEDTSKRDLVVFDLNKNIETSLVEHPADDKLLGWTPDGSGVLFASDRTGSWDTWLLQVPGGKPQGFPKLAKQGIGDVRPIGFTPHGSYYYAQERILEDVFTARLDLETGEVLSEPVPVRQTGATDCHDWSPDGKYLAYCERRADESRIIHIRTLATGRERTLADNLPNIRWLRWSLDGRSILIDGAKSGDSQGVIFKIDVRTGERSDLVRSETEVLIRPEMSPDGKTLYFARNDPKSRTMCLVARDLESGRERELLRIDPPARLTGSALSPDGQQLVLSIVPSRTGADGPVLKIVPATGGEAKELIRFDGSERLWALGVTWMPDSRNVLFWKWFLGDRSNELWRISVDGGEPLRLWVPKDRNMGPGHLRVHPDGQRIALYDRSTERSVWVMENFLPEGTGK